MKEHNSLTPFSRALIAIAVVGGIFYFLKTKTVLNSSKSSSENADAVVASDAPVLMTISGSSTLGASAVPILAKQFMTAQLNATNVSVQKVNATETDVVGTINGDEKRIVITSEGSNEGINDINNKKADLAMLSGGVDNLPNNVQLENIALDGIAIIVNKSNKIRELTKAQVRDIFQGKITNWSQVGGSSGTINCLARTAKSGTFEAFKQLALEQSTNDMATSTTYFEDSKLLIKALELDPNAIGFTSFSNIGATNALGLSDEGTAVQYPSVFTIQTEDYCLTRRLYLACLATNTNPLIQQFIEFCEADDKGQKTIAETGFVNLNLHNEDTHATIANAPPQYLAATEGAKRLPTSLHFQSGNSRPDVRAEDDIKRVMNIISEPQNRQKQVILLGFTDNVGNPNQNLALSSQRAQSIQTEFAKFGIKTPVFGFGQALPIASNTTALGQNKNRRVEVWLK